MTPRDHIDNALLVLLPECFEDSGTREPATLAEIEDTVTHFVLGRVHALLKHGARSGALYVKGRTYELLDAAKFAGVPDEDSNVVHVENWGSRKPHLMAGPDIAEVFEFPVRSEPCRPPSDDTPEAG